MPSIAQQWRISGFSVVDASKWIGIAGSSVESLEWAKLWRNAGFTPSEASSWTEFTPSEMSIWTKNGFTANKAAKYRQMKLDIPQAKLIDKYCGKGIENLYSLIQINPYEVKGRCFDFQGQTLQILSREKGLFTLGTKVFYVDFGKDAMPSTFFSGIVNGMGTYKYMTTNGSVNIVPHLHVVIGQQRL